MAQTVFAASRLVTLGRWTPPYGASAGASGLYPRRSYCFFSGAGAAAAGLTAGLGFQKAGLASIVCWEG